MPPRSGHPTAFLRGLLPALILALALLPGCGPSPGKEPGAGQEQVSGAEWEWIQSTKQTLDEKRERLAQLEAGIGGGGGGGGADPQARSQARQEVDGLTREFHRRLIEYINAGASASPGEPPNERHLAALRLKSDEDILLAREHIQRNGDYRRAIEIYESALAADPDNTRLKQELETARARRYITRERFAQVKEGMTQDEVRRLLGQPNLQDIRQYPERKVTAWFYPKDASGAAAAVWFEAGDAGTVYQLDFDAIQPGQGARPQQPRPAAPRRAPAPAGTR